MLAEMPRKRVERSDFGRRLVALRRARGLTQVQLAEAIGSSQRAISYYENDLGYPPAPVIVQLARVLRVTTDQLLGAKASPGSTSSDDPEQRRAWRKFQQLRTLPEKDQRAVIRLINSLVDAKGAEEG